MTPSEDKTPKPTAVEGYKAASGGLLGNIAETYTSDATHFDDEGLQLLKHHGSYQQDNRDVRTERRKAKLDKAWMFMVRARVPGGRMSADQYLGFDKICEQFADGRMRLTSRQTIQMHFIGKEQLKPLVKAINETGLTTLGACGDLNRNTMAPPLSDVTWEHSLGIEDLTDRIAEHFTPHATAYWEFWCDGEKWGEPVVPNTEEPIYGKTYLPRKFKMAVAAPENNCVDLYTQDIGIEIVHDEGKLIGYDLLVGGGMGYSHSKAETYPRLGSRLFRVTPEEVIQVLEAIMTVQRDFGDRTDRKHARLKYLVEEKGGDWIREQVNSRLGRTVPPAGPKPEYGIQDHLGWVQTVDGSWALGLHIDNGRIHDTEERRLRSGIRSLVETFRPQVRLTPRQDLILVGIEEKDKDAVNAMVAEFGLETDAEPSAVRRWAIACPALPTCGLALAESERFIPSLFKELEALGSGDANVEIRMTGCPNSCVRTPMAEVGIVGRGPRKYNLYVGGNKEGTALAYLLRETVEESELAPLLHRLFQAWSQQATDLSFGHWAVAQGADALNMILDAESE